ncbi:unnamed protein product, partial [Mesorhabditis spiculigera]
MRPVLILPICFMALVSSFPLQSPEQERGFFDISQFWPEDLDFKKLDAQSAECAVACTEYFMPLLGSVFRTGSNEERLNETCAEFEKAEECIQQQKDCPKNELYHTMTSGLRYMCHEQLPAFQASVQCMDNVGEQVYLECDNSCNPQALLSGLAVKEVLTQGLGQGFDGGFIKNFIDPHMMTMVASESCRIGQCMLECYRNKFNMLCEGTAGSLVSEAIVRPLDSSGSKAGLLGSVFGVFLPAQCRFMYDNSLLRKYRIDPALDKDLKRMYNAAGTAKAAVPAPALTADQQVLEALRPLYAGHNAGVRHDDGQAVPSEETSGSGAFDPQMQTILDTLPEGISGDGSGEMAAKRRRETSASLTDFFENDPLIGNEESFLMEKKDRSRNELGRTWNNVDDPASHENTPQYFAVEPGSEEKVKRLRLERTMDNADLYLAHWIIPGHQYRVDVEVEPEDQGEFVCLLRTYKAFAVNRLTDADIEALLQEIDIQKKRRSLPT